MSKVLVVSAVTGANSSDRKALAGATAAGSAPSSSADGSFLNRIEYLHILFQLTTSGTCTFYVQLWWWSPITEIWHKGERLAVNSNDIHTLEVQGLNRVYLQVDQVVGTGTLDAWLGMVVPV